LIEKTLKDVSNDNIIKIPQNNDFGTFEPSTDVKDVYKPDLLMLGM
jgi:methionyl-tRNA formyltransferase